MAGTSKSGPNFKNNVKTLHNERVKTSSLNRIRVSVPPVILQLKKLKKIFLRIKMIIKVKYIRLM